MSEQDPKDVARQQGTRVWNQWSSDDPEAKVAAEAAEEMAEVEHDDAGLAKLRALNPEDNPDVTTTTTEGPNPLVRERILERAATTPQDTRGQRPEHERNPHAATPAQPAPKRQRKPKTK